MRITIAYHGHCFDGVASAALMTRFLRGYYGETGRSSPSFRYRGLAHQVGGSHVPREVLDGDVNAVVDFRYTTAPELDWYYDHHPTGVSSEEQREHLRDDTSGRKILDTSYGSCAKLIADVATERFDFRAPELDELVHWADVIDAARFSDPETAIRRDLPALELMMVAEGADQRAASALIERLASGEPLAQIAGDPDVRTQLAPLKEQHERALEALRQGAWEEQGVVRFELPEALGGRYPKLAPYGLFPRVPYCVGVVPSATRVGITVGYNPWSPEPRRHHIASLCERYGGGGHPFVGGISLPAGDLDRAREVADALADALRA